MKKLFRHAVEILQAEKVFILPREAPQCNTAAASPWHLWNDPHPQSSLWHLHPPAPVKPPHLLDAEIIIC